MYEYSDAPDGVRRDRTGNNKDGDVQLLKEYWQKYRLYKRDKDLKAMHAAHPFLSAWDDHEVEDNNAGDTPSSAQPDPSRTSLKDLPRRVSYLERRQNGYRAFFNMMPRARFKGDRNRIYEDYRLGKLVDLMLTDERQYRDIQPCNDAILEGCPQAEEPRSMLGDSQRHWLLRSMKASRATWKLWGTQLMLMATRLAPGVAAQVDAWDGYSYERRRILNYILDNGVGNAVAITGDIHTFFAGTAFTGGDESSPGSRPAMPEFVGGSATSAGLPESTGLNPQVLAGLAAVNPHIDFFRLRAEGLRRRHGLARQAHLRAQGGRRQDQGRRQVGGDRQVRGGAGSSRSGPGRVVPDWPGSHPPTGPPAAAVASRDRKRSLQSVRPCGPLACRAWTSGSAMSRTTSSPRFATSARARPAPPSSARR
ncbi:MAG: hypothetical protein FJW90_04070 [Actinobacteria bacterium]|nr:hypothetical protein [Actinomycetota bacterium]